MTAISWKSGINGDWNTGTDWSNNAIPGSGDSVTIAAAGAYTVTIDHSEAAQSVALKAAGATLAITGGNVTFTIGTSFSVSAGTLPLTGDDFPFTTLFPPAITGGTLSTSSTGILLVNAGAGDAHSDEFDINSAVFCGHRRRPQPRYHQQLDHRRRHRHHQATDGTTSTAIKFAAGEALGNFTVLGTDSAGTGALIGFHDWGAIA